MTEESLDVTVEKMTIWDIDEIAIIENESFPTPWPPWVFVRDVSDRRSVCRVAKAGGRLVGYAVAWLLKVEMHIGNIAVAEPFRRKGIGSRLLTELIGIARENRSKRITLEVRASNARAIGLYEKFGFKRMAVKPNYYRADNEDALVMALFENTP
jgi:ribosomal-protein-alanine N-acetyltransferase